MSYLQEHFPRIYKEPNTYHMIGRWGNGKFYVTVTEQGELIGCKEDVHLQGRYLRSCKLLYDSQDNPWLRRLYYDSLISLVKEWVWTKITYNMTHNATQSRILPEWITAVNVLWESNFWQNLLSGCIFKEVFDGCPLHNYQKYGIKRTVAVELSGYIQAAYITMGLKSSDAHYLTNVLMDEDAIRSLQSMKRFCPEKMWWKVCINCDAGLTKFLDDDKQQSVMGLYAKQAHLALLDIVYPG